MGGAAMSADVAFSHVGAAFNVGRGVQHIDSAVLPIALGWLSVLERFGTLSAAEVFAPAVRLSPSMREACHNYCPNLHAALERRSCMK